MTTDDGPDGYKDNPELISSMTYRDVPMEIIEVETSDQIKITKHIMDPGYTIAIPRQTVHQLLERNTMGIYIHSLMLACMTMVNNDLDDE